jgi:hypothetical protein
MAGRGPAREHAARSTSATLKTRAGGRLAAPGASPPLASFGHDRDGLDFTPAARMAAGAHPVSHQRRYARVRGPVKDCQRTRYERPGRYDVVVDQ